MGVSGGSEKELVGKTWRVCGAELSPGGALLSVASVA